MHDWDALFKAVLANPTDDTPRLVIADWLDEHDESDRAAFIRAQVEACHTADDPCCMKKHEKATAIADKLLALHRAEWETPIRQLGASITTWSRGFPEGIRLPVETFMMNAEGVFWVAPISQLDLRCGHLTEVDMQHLTENPALQKIKFLDLADNEITDAEAQHLAASPHLQNLTHLNLQRNRIGSAGVMSLGRSPHLTNLTNLNLSLK
jgi:uncharacterized protein (TIGR02996 family)